MPPNAAGISEEVVAMSIERWQFQPRARFACTALVAVAGMLPTALPARSHPHVWVTVETTVLFEGGSISGFRHKWTFDEFYTAMAIEGLDTNKDGIYSREELAELAKVNMEGLKEFAYFTHPRLGEKRLALTEAKDYWLEYADAPPDPESAKLPKVDVLPRASEAAKQEAAQPGVLSRAWDLIFGAAKAPAARQAPKVLSLHFTVPLEQPVLPEAPDFSFGVYDASFFIALTMKGNDAVKLGPGAPASCKVVLGDAEKSADEAQRLGESFAQQLGAQNFGFAASRPVKLACGPKT